MTAHPSAHTASDDGANNATSFGAESPRTVAGALIFAARAVRLREWYASKIPFVWIACASAALTSTLSSGAIIRRSSAVLGFTFFCGAFGHLANDFADRDCDRAAGRRSEAAAMSTPLVAILLALLASLAMACLAEIHPTRETFLLGVAAIALGALYSLPPVRLKTRGIHGVWSAAAAQRTVPMAVALAAFASAPALVALMLLVVAQLAGTRWIIVHQRCDLDNDRCAAVRTWATDVGEQCASVVQKRFVFPLEILSLIVALQLQAMIKPQLWIVPAVTLILIAGNVVLRGGVSEAYSLDGFSRQPLSTFYAFLWPFGLTVALALTRPSLWLAVVAFVILQHRLIVYHVASIARRAR